MLAMKNCSSISSARILLTWTVVLALLMMLVPVYAAASEEEVSVPVQLTITPKKKKYSPGETVKIEAITKKEGESYEVFSTIAAKASQPPQQSIAFETKVVGQNYVSTAAFKPEDLGIQLDTVELQFKINMRSSSKLWAGEADLKFSVDNRPGPISMVESNFLISPEKNLKTGEAINFTVYTPNKGKMEQTENLFIFGFGPEDGEESVEQVKTIYDSRKKRYVTTGIFTPKKAGTYLVHFSLPMINEETSEKIIGSGYVKFYVASNMKIQASMSPQTASMKLGEEIYMQLTYTVSGLNSDSFTREYSEDVKEIRETYDEQTGVYKVLLLFKPRKKKRYLVEANITNQEFNVKSKAITTIHVK